jgi:hypothetical protein
MASTKLSSEPADALLFEFRTYFVQENFGRERDTTKAWWHGRKWQRNMLILLAEGSFEHPSHCSNLVKDRNVIAGTRGFRCETHSDSALGRAEASESPCGSASQISYHNSSEHKFTLTCHGQQNALLTMVVLRWSKL